MMFTSAYHRHPGYLYQLPLFFFFNDTATTEIYTLSLHDALPISAPAGSARTLWASASWKTAGNTGSMRDFCAPPPARRRDRKSTRLNSSHGYISYAVFCLKKKKILSLYRYIVQVLQEICALYDEH